MITGVNAKNKAGSEDPAYKNATNVEDYCLVKPLIVISMLWPTRIP